MKLKNILLSGLSLVLVAALAIGGTVAYLQDDDSDVNVMTLGNVKIEQHEYEREVDANGNYVTDATYGYKLRPFTQAKPLYPATELDANGNPYNNGAGNWDTTTVDMSQVGSQGTQKVFTSKNAQDKIVTVKNTGKSDAYVRTWIALEDPFTEGRIGVNVGNTDYYEQTPWTTVEIDGVKYSVIPYYNDIIPANPIIETIGRSKLINMRVNRLENLGWSFLKRICDIVVSGLGLIILSPLLPETVAARIEERKGPEEEV